MANTMNLKCAPNCACYGSCAVENAVTAERERCAKLIESGAGMADHIDDELLEMQAAMIRGAPIKETR